MTGRARDFLIRRVVVTFLALVVLAPALSVFAPSMADAQETFRRPSLLRDLFLFRRLSRPPAPEKIFPEAPKKPKRVVRAAPQPKVPVVEKLPDARTVLVVGDFLGSGLADGLNESFAENPRIKVAKRTNSSSGLVRNDVYDWPAKIGELIDSEKPAAIVVMLGANDRQQMRIGRMREAALSDNWNKEYTRRTEALADAIAARKIPFLWVGMPPFKSSKMQTDILALNDMYRAAAESAGGEFIDVWEGFVDENGAYIASGPDINGQPVRLRANDGINLTGPGKRKVAFYTEKPLNKLLGETPGSGVALLPHTAAPAIATPAVDIGSIERTMPVSLKDPELDGGLELLGAVAGPKSQARSPGEKLAVDGIAPAAPIGRADDFSWTPPAASGAGTIAAKP